MGYARSLVVPQDAGGNYHCYSRCVRRERLLETPDRVAVLERRLAFLSTRVFAIDLIEFKPMGNHVHCIVRTHPELAWCWTDEEVARRWLLLSLAGRRPDLDADEGPSPAAIASLAAKKPRIEELRSRLANLGAYHSAWKEWSAKRWNREDGTSGHFWQGRYGVTTALDDGALLTQSVYVLLNAVHAGLENELGTRTPGSLKTRIERLVRQAISEATAEAKAEAFERDFVHASWTPVYPCDPGSAAELDDDEFARRVADGRHRASFRRSLREEASALSHFAATGEGEEVERAARELREESEGETGNNQLADEATPPPRRPRPKNVPRHRSWPERAAAARTELRPDASAWRQPWPNPFLATRLVGGAVPVVRGVTLGVLLALADAEGRHPRPDKRGSIAKDAEPAILILRKAYLGDGPSIAALGVPHQPSDADAPADATASEAITSARRLADALRERVAELVARVWRPTSDGGGAADTPSAASGAATEHKTIAVTQRGSVFGSRPALDAETARRGGSRVHVVRPQLRE